MLQRGFIGACSLLGAGEGEQNVAAKFMKEGVLGELRNQRVHMHQRRSQVAAAKFTDGHHIAGHGCVWCQFVGACQNALRGLGPGLQLGGQTLVYLNSMRMRLGLAMWRTVDVILKRAKTFIGPRVGGIVGGFPAFRNAALACHPCHQVTQPDSGGAGRLEQLDADLVGNGLIAAARGKESANRCVVAADQHTRRGIAAAGAGGKRNGHKRGRRGRGIGLLQRVIKALHMPFLQVTKLMRHDPQIFTDIPGLGQQAGMYIDHPLAGDKGVVVGVEDNPHGNLARRKTGSRNHRRDQRLEAGFDLAVTDHAGAADGRAGHHDHHGKEQHSGGAHQDAHQGVRQGVHQGVHQGAYRRVMYGDEQSRHG